MYMLLWLYIQVHWSDLLVFPAPSAGRCPLEVEYMAVVYMPVGMYLHNARSCYLGFPTPSGGKRPLAVTPVVYT